MRMHLHRGRSGQVQRLKRPQVAHVEQQPEQLVRRAVRLGTKTSGVMRLVHHDHIPRSCTEHVVTLAASPSEV